MRALTLREALHIQWQDVGREVRVACTLLLVSGASLMLIGIAGDYFGWWVERSFLTNVLSSVAGACFGIPAAILLFSAISERRTAVTVRRERVHQGSLAAERLRVYAAAFTAVDPARDLIGSATQIAEKISSFREIADSPSIDTEAVRRELSVMAAGMNRGRDLMLRSLPLSIADAERQWAELCNSWRLINDVIRSEYLASDLGWFDDATQTKLQAYLYDRPNPFAYILDLRDYYLPEYAAECKGLSVGEAPLDLGSLKTLRLHHIQEEEVWNEGLRLLELLEHLHEGVEVVSLALCHPGMYRPQSAQSDRRQDVHPQL